MAELDSAQAQETVSHETQNKPASVSFSIWPPTQRTRDAVINRLIESLSAPSILSKRYGTLPHDEASDTARLIEEEAFAAAGSMATGNDDGIGILEFYSKEISKRMIDTVKSRSAPAADSTPLPETESKPSESPADASEPPSASGLTGEVSSVETES
ncbi:RNA polymerase III-inhibiting protein maf1 [Datura stramonium]|uniref:RNA polymerase III-inhibiting protein maf1 n=1 Tax=Datura stramonium TaxID=4076 RepID=A0ABS8T3D7_DATST|nr:RNA polymerase III-inhibiting protein maf1 [Datura stramonium]